MPNPSRDLIVLMRQIHNRDTFNKEITRLNDLLYSTETLETFVQSHELVDINKHKIIRSKIIMKNYVKQRKETPFVFLSNCN